MKKTLGLVVLVLALSGCMHAAETVVVSEDGSAMIETSLKVHKGTLDMVDAMLGGMMQAFQQMAAQMTKNAPGDQPAPPVKSIAEEMFANKDQVMKNFEKAGVKADLLSFTSEKKDDGLYVDYKVRVDNALDLVRMEGNGLTPEIYRNDNGDWYCRIKKDEKKAGENREQLAKFRDFKDSPSFKAMPPEVQQGISGAFMDFKVSLTITLPRPIKLVSGAFEKVDEHTVRFVQSMDLVADPGAMERLLLAGSEDSVIATDENFVPSLADASPRGEEASPVPAASRQEPVSPAPAAESPLSVGTGGKVRVLLKDGSVSEGRLIERTADHVKIDFEGVAITYYNDEFTKVE
jgi:hypothetical protein